MHIFWEWFRFHQLHSNLIFPFLVDLFHSFHQRTLAQRVLQHLLWLISLYPYLSRRDYSQRDCSAGVDFDRSECDMLGDGHRLYRKFYLILSLFWEQINLSSFSNISDCPSTLDPCDRILIIECSCCIHICW